MTTKSASDTLKVLKDIMFDLDNLAMQKDRTPVSYDIIFKIRNTMSHRAATEEAFNKLLESYRGEILTDVVDTWRVGCECAGKHDQTRQHFVVYIL